MSTDSVAAAVLARRSVRAFTPEPVPDAIMDDILSASLRAPSGGNLQPWHLHVVRGATLGTLRSRVRQAIAAGQSEVPNHAVYPESLWDPYRARRFENGEALYHAIGIGRRDRPARLAQLSCNFQLFGAPVGLFFAIDRRMGAAQWIDIGILMQTIMLLAVDRDLATCPQAVWAMWPDTLRDVLGLDEQMVIIAGLSLGFEDKPHPINAFRTTRAVLSESVSFHE